MKRYMTYALSAWLMIGSIFLVPEKVFSQTAPKEDKPKTTVMGITSGRARSLAGVAMGLISLVIGWRAVVLSGKDAGSARTGAIVALVLGLVGIVLSVIHLATSYSAAFGTGAGKAGAIVGLVLGLIGTILGGLALRSRKIA